MNPSVEIEVLAFTVALGVTALPAILRAKLLPEEELAGMTSYQFAACINDMRSAAVALTSAEPPAKHTRQSSVATAAAAPQVVHYPAVNQVDYLTDPAVFVLAVNFFDKQLTTLGWKEKVKTQAAAQSARTSLVAVPSENFGEIPGQRSARQRNIANMSGFDSVLHNEIIKHA